MLFHILLKLWLFTFTAAEIQNIINKFSVVEIAYSKLLEHMIKLLCRL